MELCNSNRELGIKGENAALDHYLSKKYKLIEKNWRIRQGEIDLIFRKDDTLIFVEVKTKTDDSYTRPLEQITFKKQQKLVLLTQLYLTFKKIPKKISQVRIDAAEVLINEGAFEVRVTENIITL